MARPAAGSASGGDCGVNDEDDSSSAGLAMGSEGETSERVSRSVEIESETDDIAMSAGSETDDVGMCADGTAELSSAKDDDEANDVAMRCPRRRRRRRAGLAPSSRHERLPQFGYWRQETGVCTLPVPLLSVAPSLGAILTQIPGRASRRHYTAPLWPIGVPRPAHRYGTPRLFRCSQVTAPVLTRRNKTELPTILHFDALHRAAVGEDELKRRLVGIA
jgi:hypothetical protein